MPKVQIESDAQWHELRKRNIGGSDIAALFGCSPWATAFTLWSEKAGIVEHAVEENTRMRLGKFLEPFIASEIGRELGWTVERSKEYYLSETVPGMGATLDFDILDHQWGPGICETKCVFDHKSYLENWSEDRAPPHVELQTQHQLATTGRPWAAIVVLVVQTGTVQPAIIRRPIPEVISQIENKVREFWQSVKERRRPEPTGTDDELAIMRKIWPAREPRKIIEIPSAELAGEAELFRWASESLAGLERQRTASKTKLLAAAEDAELLKLPNYNVNVKQDKRGFIRVSVAPADNGVKADGPHPTLEAG
jgi:putative phage-type endonuclease